MASKHKESVREAPISVSPPELWRLSFSRESDIPRDQDRPKELTVNTALAVSRLGPAEIGVEFGLQFPELPFGEIDVAYRARFKVNATEEIEDLDTVLREVASRLAPATLYPFIREAVSSLMGRTSMQSLTLPIVDFASAFDPEETEVPDWDD